MDRLPKKSRLGHRFSTPSEVVGPCSRLPPPVRWSWESYGGWPRRSEEKRDRGSPEPRSAGGGLHGKAERGNRTWKPFVMWVMENPAWQWGLSLLSQMGENAGVAG